MGLVWSVPISSHGGQFVPCIGEGVQNGFWGGGVLWYFLPCPEFSTRCTALRVQAEAFSRCEAFPLERFRGGTFLENVFEGENMLPGNDSAGMFSGTTSRLPKSTTRKCKFK